MIFVTVRLSIDGYRIILYKGTVQRATINDMIRHARHMRANAIFNACYDNALNIDTSHHGTTVAVERTKEVNFNG
ncbi:MAG: hypothetical protein ACRD2P_01205 [Terriglobia bacterium]